MRIMSIVASLSFACVSTQGLTAHAQSASSDASALHAQAPGSQSLAAAHRVVTILYPDETQLAAADNIIRKHHEPVIRSNKDFIALERRYPGFINALIADLRAQNRANTKRLLPAFREEIAQLYAARLSAPELDDLAMFYASPTGRKLVNGMAESADMSAQIRERAQNGQVSAQSITTDVSGAAANVVQGLGSNDFDALLALRDKPYFRRLLALRAPVTDVHRSFAAKAPAVLTLRADRIIANLSKKNSTRAR